MRRFLAGTLVGLAAGFAVGWFVRGGPETPPSAAVAAAPVPASPTPDAPSRGRETKPPAPAPAAAPRPPEAPRADRSAAIGTASADELQKLDEPFSAAEIDALIARIDHARENRDGEVFHRALGLLVSEPIPEDRRTAVLAKVVEIVGDASLDVDPWVACTAPSLVTEATARDFVASVRRRFGGEVVFASGRPDMWLGIVAMHGAPDDLAWLATQAKSDEFGEAARDAVTTSRREALAPVVETWLEKGLVRGEDLEKYAMKNAEPAFSLYSKVIAAGATTGKWPPACEPWEVFRAYARAAPIERVPDVRRTLLELPTRELRADAVAAVQALFWRDVDPKPFASLLDEPPRILDDASASYAQVAHTAWLASASEVAWSPALAASLERAADRFASEEYAPQMRREAQRMRAKLKDPLRAK
jgi:hypothetical protein